MAEMSPRRISRTPPPGPECLDAVSNIPDATIGSNIKLAIGLAQWVILHAASVKGHGLQINGIGPAGRLALKNPY